MEQLEVQTMVLDLKDAFMGIPLHPAELPFNCCCSDLLIDRKRDELYPGEPAIGRFVIWVVLGFGGKPNPLVFGRVASFVSRIAQALLRVRPDSRGTASAAVGRLQLYVARALRHGLFCRMCGGHRSGDQWVARAGHPTGLAEGHLHECTPHLDRSRL